MKIIFLSFLSSLLLILSFPKFNLSFLAWIGFLPLFIACEGSNRKQSFFLFYISGFIFWAGILYWLIQVSFIGFLLLVFYLALYFGVLGFFVSIVQSIVCSQQFTENSPLFLINCFLFLPSLWVVLEFIRSHLFTGFGWALLGYSQYLNLPIIQIADITGAYGVSFLVMLVNTTFYSVIRKKKKNLFSILSILCILTALIYGHYQLTRQQANPPTGKLSVSVIQGNIPQEQKWDKRLKKNILDKYIFLTQRAANQNLPNLIIWPETAVPAYFNQDEDVKNRILNLSQEINASLLIGAATFKNNKPYTSLVRGKSFNSAILISRGKIVSQYDKLHLVPFGEYVSSLFSFTRHFIDIGDFSFGKEWTVFTLPALRSSFPAFSVLICFEDVFPYLSRGFVRRGANFLINISNDAWFGNSSAPYQHCQSTVFRAVENRMNIIKCSNTGISCFISPKGKIFGKFSKYGRDIFVDGYSTEEILVRERPLTFYTSFGDVFAVLCLLFCAGFVIIERNKIR